jgi:hypothetical protein
VCPQVIEVAAVAVRCCSNYTPSWLELSGINGAAEDLVLRPATALLLSDPDLLADLRNATLVQARGY